MSRVGERRAWLADRLDVCRRLGPGWLGFRLRYAAERRLGIQRRRSPIADWPQPAGRLRGGLPRVVDCDGLRDWLRSHANRDQSRQCQELVEQLRRGEFNVFGSSVRPSSWHHDPIYDVVYDHLPHWSQVDEFDHADIKCVWEPSRFGWAFDLVRAEHLGVSGAGDLFWQLLEDWMQSNPPNSGVNWVCGQEAGIRLMAATIAAAAMPHTWSTGRLDRLEQLTEVTADRIFSNIAYARSQKNNHHASESVALVAAALVLPAHTRAQSWWRAGTSHLNEVASELIFADGGSSQYSTNYHRVFLHNFAWATVLSRHEGKDLGPIVANAFCAATRYLEAIMEPVSGHAPFFGADDGAELLPSFFGPHRLVGPDVQLCRAICSIDQIDYRQEWGEWLAWFGLTITRSQGGSAPAVGYRHFPDMGTIVLWSGRKRVFVRCGPLRYRPSQDDQLHCDVWDGGEVVNGDPGTFSYKPAPGEPGALDSVSDHNVPCGRLNRPTPKVGRFLFARWEPGRVHELAVHGSEVRLRASVGDSAPIHLALELDQRGMRLLDGTVLNGGGNVRRLGGYRWME